MKPIKLCIENSEAIRNALRDANGRATKHTYTTARDILGVVQEAMLELDALQLPTSRANGARYTKCSGEWLPRSYNNTAIQTMVTVERRSSGWYLVHANACPLFPKMNNKGRLALTQEQADEAARRLRARFDIIEMEDA